MHSLALAYICRCCNDLFYIQVPLVKVTSQQFNPISRPELLHALCTTATQAESMSDPLLAADTSVSVQLLHNYGLLTETCRAAFKQVTARKDLGARTSFEARCVQIYTCTSHSSSPSRGHLLTWYLLVELNGISTTLGFLSLISLTEPQHNSMHFRSADSEASPATAR